MSILFVVLFLVCVGFSKHESVESNAGKCELCTYVVGHVEQFIADNKTEQEIEKGLERVCGLLPKQYYEQCKEIVDEYLPFIINFVEEELPAKKVCQLIGLCPTEKNIVESSPNPEMCDICKYAVNLVDTFLKDNKTEEEILSALEKFCSLLPDPYHDECKAMVDQFLPVIIDFIETKTPEQICQLIKLCPAEEVVVEEENMDECDLCKWAVKLAEKWIADNKTESEIMEELNKLCGFLPEQYVSLCKTFVDEYVPTIIDYIEEEMPADVLCKKIGLCKSRKRYKMPFTVSTIKN